MSVANQESELVVLHDVPCKTYERIVEVLGEHHLRHAYDQGTLEMRAVVNGVSWDEYRRFVDALGDYSLKHSFNGWSLEMMSPRKDHEWNKKFIGRIVETVALTLEIDIQCIGSTTLTSDAVERGLQPDEAYYIANEPRVRGKMTYEADVDPPPDLLIEVDVTNTSVPRMPLFAKLRIPEVWRHDGQQMRFYRLTERAEYQKIESSVAFPFLSSDDIDECLDQLHELSENAVLRTLLNEVQKRFEKINKGSKE